jgi:hypothetical protein
VCFVLDTAPSPPPPFRDYEIIFSYVLKAGERSDTRWNDVSILVRDLIVDNF